MGYFKIRTKNIGLRKNEIKVEKCRIAIDLPANSMYNIDVRIYKKLGNNNFKE